jgi:hypothetical protein
MAHQSHPETGKKDEGRDWTMTSGRPVQRQSDLSVRQLGDELLIYDGTNKVAHCLNETTALIWSRCDGQTTMEELAAGLPLDAEAARAVVLDALDQLHQAQLLAAVPAAVTASSLSRRQVLARVGLGIALPTVLTVMAPSAAQAGSFRAGHGPVPPGQQGSGSGPGWTGSGGATGGQGAGAANPGPPPGPADPAP